MKNEKCSECALCYANRVLCECECAGDHGSDEEKSYQILIVVGSDISNGPLFSIECHFQICILEVFGNSPINFSISLEFVYLFDKLTCMPSHCL